MLLSFCSSRVRPTRLSRTPVSCPSELESSISWTPWRKFFFEMSVASRTPFTVAEVAAAPCASGPAVVSRSFWSAAASSVACLVMSVSSFMLSSCWMSSIDWLMRSAPSEVAATTGSASSETRRVEMRQFRRAIREPGPLGPVFGFAAGLGGAVAPGRAERSPLPPTSAGPGFWACWGEEPRSAPPCGSGSAGALPSLLKRPCTSVATSGPGASPGKRRGGVGVVQGRRCAPWWS